MILPTLLLLAAIAVNCSSANEVGLYAEGNETAVDPEFAYCVKIGYNVTVGDDKKGNKGKACVGCLNIENEVMTEYGRQQLKYLKPGDKILTVSHEGKLKYEEMMADGHRLPELETWFYKISVGGKSIMLTPGHYLYTGEDIDHSRLIRADEVKTGDSLLLTDSTNLDPDYTNLDADSTNLVVKRVDKVEKVLSRGISNPLLPSGRILVEGILASVYSDEFNPLSVAHQHGFLWLIRQIHNLIPESSLLGDVLPSLIPYLDVVDKYLMSG